ncbi:hypothetical protein BDW59DRAFT_138164 [Aspergillus cavernicola]|uniref:Uncharacterized protein n=1 Tax=Aspergillus cavernicola TaxID=176166 RepID=A0ABR4J155_9EURO
MPHTFLPAPNFNIPPPPECPLVLGQILARPDDPLYPLNAGNVIAPLDGPLITSPPATGFSASRSQLKERGFKVWAKLSDLFPVGANGQVGSRSGMEDLFTIERVETSFFLPSPAYLEESLKCEAVRRYLDGSRWRKSLFIVTGIKVARNAKVRSSMANRRNAGGEISVDTTQIGVPLSAGGGAESNTESNENTSFESDGFLLAFEVREIKCSKSKPPKTKPYTKGAMFEAGVQQGQVGDDLFYTLVDADTIPVNYTEQAFGPLGLSTVESDGDMEERFYILA